MGEVLNNSALRAAYHELDAAECNLGDLRSALDEMSDGDSEDGGYEECADAFGAMLERLQEYLDDDRDEALAYEIRQLLRRYGR